MRHENQIVGSARTELWNGSERRSHTRQLTLDLAVRIAAQGNHGMARALNLSDEGVQLSTLMKLLPGDEIALEFLEGCSIKGQVMWQSDARCGIQFAAPLDSATLLRGLSDAHLSGQFRKSRVARSKAVIVRSELGVDLLRAQDISQRGMELMHDGRFNPGMQVKVQIATGVERRGVVRWSNSGRAGITLTAPLSVEHLGSINSI